MILVDEVFGFLFLHKTVPTRGKGWFPLTTKAVVDVNNYELLVDYACIFSGQLWPAFSGFCFFFSPCSPLVQSHILQRLSELIGFQWWERLVCFGWFLFFFFKVFQWRMCVIEVGLKESGIGKK